MCDQDDFELKKLIGTYMIAFLLGQIGINVGIILVNTLYQMRLTFLKKKKEELI